MNSFQLAGMQKASITLMSTTACWASGKKSHFWQLAQPCFIVTYYSALIDSSAASLTAQKHLASPTENIWISARDELFARLAILAYVLCRRR